MKTLEKQITQATEQYGITLRKTLVTHGTIVLYSNNIEDFNKLVGVLSKLKAKIVTNKIDLTVSILF